MKSFIPAALCLLLVVSGCYSYTYPTTDAFANRVTPAGERVIVWGGHTTARNTAITWLQERGLSVVDQSMVRATNDPATVISAASDLGVSVVIFMETPFQLDGASESVEKAALGAKVSASSEALYTQTVNIRAVNIASGAVDWSASAGYPKALPGLDDSFVRLTCSALATAWGFRPEGNHEIGGLTMCDLQ